MPDHLLSADNVALTEEAVADAKRRLERAKTDHQKVAESLADVVSSAVKVGELDEVVEQVRSVQTVVS